MNIPDDDKLKLMASKKILGHVESAEAACRARLVIGPAPPTQKADPIYQTHLRMNQWADCSREEYDYYVSGGVIKTRVLHAHPANDKLRRAAQELVNTLDRLGLTAVTESLRAALNTSEKSAQAEKENVGFTI